MKPVPPETWPPIIHDASMPRVIVWRDRLLTAAMWLLLIWFCREPLLALGDFLAPPFGKTTHMKVPSLQSIWERAAPYYAVILLFCGWIFASGLATLRRYRRARQMAHPPALALEDQARRAGCTPAELTQWRTFKVAVVHLDEHGALTVVAKDGTGS
jgi:poly-beta-1,6-N-acetyl-D-glucosamine biosynthesis protein PgaD